MFSRKVVEIGSGRGACERGQTISSIDLPDVPVMPETLLLMDLGAREKPVDLGEMTQVVLSDPGATIQVLRLAGRERAFGEERATRIEDCISVLGVLACVEAVSRRTVSRAKDKPGIVKCWLHAKEIAENCQRLAQEMAASVNPNDAYLTGLLHELGALPAILNWERATTLSSDPDLVGLKLADEWFLPQCVLDYFSELENPRAGNRWTGIVQRAHEISKSASEQSPAEEDRESRVSALLQQ